MKNYSPSDFRSLFQHRFDLARWQGVLADFFGATKLRERPEAVKLPPSEKDSKGFLLGELDTSDGVRIGLFRYTVPALQVERRRVGLRHLVDAWLKYDFDAALVVFDSKESEKWRFSLISDMRGEKTSPRRYTYVFGDSASLYRTAVDRFSTLAARDDASEPVAYSALRDAFAVESLTREFYNELFNWYLWALSPEMGVTFPNDISTDADDRAGLEEKLIRLITRIMFVWFIRQKKLVPDLLFSEKQLSAWLKDFDPHSLKHGNYYNAILQNLFFATLNNEIGNRAFATDVRDGRGRAEDYGIKTLFRNPKGGSWFKRPDDEVLKVFREVPFLNGGLFECLDKAAADDPRGRIIYNDGFSREKGRQRRAFIPNELFFADESSRTFTITGGRPSSAAETTTRTVSGLLKILGKYNFTIEENSPDDMDIALDPELLGKVFENLLGSFNPETRETARNSSGSFYTPREIVNYMVAESLAAYMKPVQGKSEKAQLDHLMRIRVLDPACGSGAFPMGMLNAIVAKARELGCTDDLHTLKLHVIENCIFGIDIQTIAVQIAKLRFFISLVCEERPNLTDAENNYGISPLPNLETKFVAANSLIAKKRAEAQGDLFEMAMIDGLKQKLYDIRHRHFNAKTRKDKISLRKEDEKTRAELVARLTDNNLFAAADARQLAAWNPYDQNESASFFDPEWMFGVKRGFDVVIGNPPYGIINKRQNKSVSIVVDDDVLRYYKEAPEYDEARGRGSLNIYRLFIQKSLNLLVKEGVFAEIFPLAFAGDLSAARLRQFVFSKYRALSFDAFPERDNPQKRVFEAAKMSVCILVAQNALPDGEMRLRINLDRFIDGGGGCFNITETALEQLDPEYRRLPIAGEMAYWILLKMRNRACRLREVGRCATGEMDMTFAKTAFTTNSKFPGMLRGAGVGRYEIREELSQGEHLFIDESKVSDIGKIAALKQQLRLVMQGITGVNEQWRLKATLAQGVYCANSVNYIVGVPNIKFVLGLFNSRLLNFFFAKFSTNSNVNGYEVDELPLIFPPATAAEQKRIIGLVDRILAAKAADAGADVSALEAEIDALVYRLYGLTEDEIAVVDGRE